MYHNHTVIENAHLSSSVSSSSIIAANESRFFLSQKGKFKENQNHQQQICLNEAVIIFQVASYSLIEQCMLDAGYSRQNVINSSDAMYVEFVKYAIGSELNRINRIMSSIPEFANYQYHDASKSFSNTNSSNISMMNKALIMFQVKICSIIKQSMMQANFRSYETYECHYSYITFAQTALRAELNRVSVAQTPFDVIDHVTTSTSTSNNHNKVNVESTINHRNNSAASKNNTNALGSLLSTTNQHHHNKVVFDALSNTTDSGANNSTTVSTHASDSTRLMGSLTGRKRFFEQLSDQDDHDNDNDYSVDDNKGSGALNKDGNNGCYVNFSNGQSSNACKSRSGNKYDGGRSRSNKLSAPVILNPYYYQQPFATDSSKDKRKK